MIKFNKIHQRNLIIALAVIVIAAGGLYFYYYWRALPKRKTPEQNPIRIAPERSPVVDIFFTTRADFAPYGDFYFKYPSDLRLGKDTVEKNLLGKEYHFVTLEDAYATGESPDRIEINKPGASCADYKNCSEIKGIVLGTNSENSEFIRRFKEVVKSFKVQ